MSFSNTSTPEGNVPLLEIDPSIEPGTDFNESAYHLSSQESDTDTLKAESDGEADATTRLSMNMATGEMPCLEEFPGIYDFSLMMGGATTLKNNRRNWEYSLQMNKLFVKVGCSVPISFKINNQLDWTDLHIRGLLVFDNPDESRKPVVRCINHKDPLHKSNTGIEPDAINHVLCCQHSGALYETDDLSGRHSVNVPIGEPQAGATFTTILFALGCKSSCESGINRRSTSIIFTLEKNQLVVGRHVVRVRICSCPKRDMCQELDQVEAVHSETPVRGKKRKIVDPPPRIKSEEYSPAHGMVVPVPVPVPYNSTGEFTVQSRFEPLNYMEFEDVYNLQVRSPAHYKILLTKAYELFKCRVTHQAAIYENLLKHVP